MDPDPARSDDDFYRDYDPWVGIGTALILALFFLLITLKTFMKWLLMKVTIWRYRYQKYQEGKQKIINHCSTDPTTVTISTAIDNGHVVIS